MSSSFRIACPNPACAKPLNLPAVVVGQPLSCPHCGTGIAVTLGPDGAPIPTAIKSRRVPTMLLVPGFALLILGAAGVFANGYVATEATFRPGASVELARRTIDYLRDADTAGAPNRKKNEDNPREAYTALVGTAAGVATEELIDQRRAEEAAPYVGPVCWSFVAVSLVMAGGGLATLLGRWYWLALAGSVAALVNVNLCCCVPGLVAGLWGILTLSRDDGRRHFGR